MNIIVENKKQLKPTLKFKDSVYQSSKKKGFLLDVNHNYKWSNFYSIVHGMENFWTLNANDEFKIYIDKQDTDKYWVFARVEQQTYEPICTFEPICSFSTLDKAKQAAESYMTMMER